MFTTERYTIQNDANSSEKGNWASGTRFAERHPVKQDHSYRRITLIVGIGVALIVMLTLWASRKGSPLAVVTQVTTILSSVEVVPSFEEVVRRVVKVDL